MVDDLTPYKALMAAADRAGSLAALARICGCTPQAVTKWVQSSKRLPGRYALAVEAATGIPRHLLCPDMYPADLPASGRFLGVDQWFDRVSFETGRISQRPRRSATA
jgi:Uncharacterized protein conserved in bacteria, prophage-related